MKVLLFLNGPEGYQTGIEDGFNFLLSAGKISTLKWFYFNDFAAKNSEIASKNKMIDLALKFQPDLIVFFHIGSFSIDEKFILEFKRLNSQPILGYDEGDMYGGWSKPITKKMKGIMGSVDIVSIRGLGKFYDLVKKINKNLIYVPHSNSLYRFSKGLKLPQQRDSKVIFMGNRVTSRFGNLVRLSGALGREKLVYSLTKELPNRLNVYGKGWANLITNKGHYKFHEQIDVCSKSWIHVSFEHYPEIPYYFSDRLPIALASGQIYVCHYHEGYENIFNGCDFIYFFRSNKEALDIINYLNSLSKDELYKKSVKAKAFSETYLSPTVVWNNFFEKCKELKK
tara:strand:+ start:40 stop:1059 length:1020 start_codon:yes stop_codon:yes gene_type:complete